MREEGAIHARITTLRTTPEQHDEGLRILAEELVPWARSASGYRGLLRLDSREAETTMVVTLWATREALDASREAMERLGRMVTEVSGAAVVSIEQYEVSFADVPVSLTSG